MTLPAANIQLPVSADADVDANFNYLDGLCSRNGISMAFGSSVLRGMRMISFSLLNAPSGNNAIYLVPEGKRAIAIGTIYNTAGTTTTFFNVLSFDGSATWFRSNGDTGVATKVTSAFGSQNLMAEAGQTIGINFSQTGCNVFSTIYEFSADSPFKTIIKRNFNFGQNILYTVPSNIVAIMGGNNVIGAGGPGTSNFIIANETGSSLIPKIHIVAAGGIIGSTNIIHNPVAGIANNATGSFSIGLCMAAGTQVIYDAPSGAKQLMWFPILEIPV